MKYHVEGNHVKGYAIVMDGGGIEYDHLETKAEADEICDVLNRGIAGSMSGGIKRPQTPSTIETQPLQSAKVAK